MGVWNTVTNSAPLHYTLYGKPSQLTFEFAERKLEAYNRAQSQSPSHEVQPSVRYNDGKGGEKSLRKVYMIGDNPHSDIRGGNTYSSPRNTVWETLLVRSGVYNDSDGAPAYKPSAIVDDVWDAVKFGLEREGWG